MGQTTTYPAAVDVMYGMLYGDWQSQAARIIGQETAPEMRYQGIEYAKPPAVTAFWSRLSEQLVIESQASLAGSNGSKIYTSQGLIYAQIFCPQAVPGATDTGRLLAYMMRNTLRKRVTDETVWFRDATIVPVGLDSGWFQFNVKAKYQFDELR
jgi:hypothetical protein